ncbi:mandelate racemase/muconate lactonizing enzyme family protein [Micromonospora sp. CB01531]|uniref:mandelate racemase/muconate lactonizing enzyme family protein n=1 Tax=Micromonospora sp. CB01531 TaxID=1718947 RepID=UPI00093D0498|nr:mandelate racemase/muconate lactonizing enzyme family protein [Micromonospora sp. CB01531]
MKITNVEPLFVPDGANVMLLVLVSTDSGEYGVGEVGMRARWRTVRGAVDDLAELLVGADPSRIEHLWQVLFRSGFFPATGVLCSVLAAIDVALWDLRGKTLGVPLYQLLGGASRDHVECYVHVTSRDPEAMVAECERHVEAGWRYLRVPANSPGADGEYDQRAALRHTVAVMQRLRSALGHDVELLLDVHTRFDPAEAVTLCRELEPLRPYFVEDPLRSENLDGYRMLRQRTTVPLAAGEQLGTKWEFRPLIEGELIDHARVDVANTGLTEARKIAAMAEVHHINLATHSPLGPVTAAASAHLNLALPNVSVQEQPRPAFPPSEVFTALPRLAAGRITPAERPGLGVELDLAAARRALPRGPAPLPQLQRPDGSFTNW